MVQLSAMLKNGYNIVYFARERDRKVDVAKDKGEYAARTCHSLFHQCGYMAAATYRKQSVYKVTPNAEKEFYCLYLTGETMRDALSGVGFNIKWFEMIRGDKVEFNATGWD